MNKTLYPTLVALLGLAACSVERVSLLPSYKLKVVQGNGLDPRTVASLQPGMTRDQVILLLDTPLLHGPFHADRWDYTSNTSHNGVIKEQIDPILYLEDELFARVEGNAIQKAIGVVQAEQKPVSGG